MQCISQVSERGCLGSADLSCWALQGRCSEQPFDFHSLDHCPQLSQSQHDYCFLFSPFESAVNRFRSVTVAHRTDSSCSSACPGVLPLLNFKLECSLLVSGWPNTAVRNVMLQPGCSTQQCGCNWTIMIEVWNISLGTDNLLGGLNVPKGAVVH